MLSGPRVTPLFTSARATLPPPIAAECRSGSVVATGIPRNSAEGRVTGFPSRITLAFVVVPPTSRQATVPSPYRRGEGGRRTHPKRGPPPRGRRGLAFRPPPPPPGRVRSAAGPLHRERI